MFRGRHWYFPDVSCAHFHFFAAWELSKIGSNTPEDNFYSRYFIIIIIFAAHSCSDVYLSVLSLNITDDSCHILCLHSNARLVPLREAVKGPNKDRSWSLDHFWRQIILRPKLLFQGGKCAPRSRTAPAIVHALVSRSELQGSFPACEYFDEGSYWRAEWRAKTTGGCVRARRIEKWMKCAEMCACQARIKIKVIVRRVCVCVCVSVRERERERESSEWESCVWRMGYWGAGGGETSHLQPWQALTFIALSLALSLSLVCLSSLPPSLPPSSLSPPFSTPIPRLAIEAQAPFQRAARKTDRHEDSAGSRPICSNASHRPLDVAFKD